jgi:hypothetical protein
MTYPFLRDGERGRAPLPTRTVGIVVVPAGSGGKRYFFPGATSDLAMVYAKAAFGAVLDQPPTIIEFGEANGTAWIVRETVKAPMPELTG